VNHAQIKIGEFTVPLIGVDGEAVLERCDLCHDIFSIQQIRLDGTQFLCPRCRSILNTSLNTTEPQPKPPQPSTIHKVGWLRMPAITRVIIDESGENP